MESTVEPLAFVLVSNYAVAGILMMIGVYAIIAKQNLIKKIVGLVIFQSAIILFYVSLGFKANSSIPIVPMDHDSPTIATSGVGVVLERGRQDTHALELDVDQFVNPVPHVLMLTAIVVGVATLGVALALCERIYERYGTLEENALLTVLGGGEE